MLPNVYLILAGAGDKTYSVDLRNHITDADSLLRYTVDSSAPTVAEAKEKNATLTVMPKTAGDAMITVTGHDDEGGSSISDEFMVKVVATNAAPTTSGLNRTDIEKLETPLYVVEGLRATKVTVRSNAGAAGSAMDSIVVDGIKIEINGTPDKKDDLVTVTVKKDIGDHKYIIEVNPTAAAMGKGPQAVKIYPEDKFGAIVSEPWTFNAVFNTIPRILDTSIDLGVPLVRPGTPSTDNSTRAVKIANYFDFDSLSRTVKGTTDATMVDEVGDTVCTVSSKSSSSSPLAVVQLLNETGDSKAPATVGPATGDAEAADLVTGDQALFAVLIDTRYSDLGTPNLIGPANIDVLTVGQRDALTTATGTLSITITCSDKDHSVTATGDLVIRPETGN